jgi:trans-aconitate methyltransferase
MNLEAQPGWQQRSILVARHARWLADGAQLAGGTRAIGLVPVRSVTDLGCGDGALLALLATVMPAGLPMWGYEINAGDVAYARGRGLDVRQASILDPGLEYGDLLIATEVLEHLADPEAFLRGLPGKLLIVSSPSAETGDWHNPIHAWAWDMAGYSALLQRSGWTVLAHNETDGGPNTFAEVTRQQRFQAILATRDLLKIPA